MLILHAAREVVEGEGFDEMLDNVRDRVDEIESLHRTRELTVSVDSIWLWLWGINFVPCYSSRTSAKAIGLSCRWTKVARWPLMMTASRCYLLFMRMHVSHTLVLNIQYIL